MKASWGQEAPTEKEQTKMKKIVIEQEVTFEEATAIAEKQGINVVICVSHYTDENGKDCTEVMGV